MRHAIIIIIAGLLSGTLAGCASGPQTPPVRSTQHPKPQLPKGARTALPDRTYFHQQDPRWAKQTLGGSGEPLESDGCLVTAAAMALSNLGFQTDPGDLTRRLKATGGFNNRGWLVWSGLEKVTGGRATARFYKDASHAHVKRCLADGYYPLVKFKLPSRSPHWAVVVADSDKGFYVRDPMVAATVPIPLSARASGIDAVRCVGVDRV